MKIMTILGTRPEIIRLSLVIRKLDKVCKHILVHTGQNYADSLNDIFFKDLKVRNPDYALGIKENNIGSQIGKIISETGKLLTKEKPDKLLLLGDTNSALSSVPAKRMGIPVYHLEAGNRCYDDRVPEEVNRRIIDHTSDVLMPYTYRSKENLIREGISRERIFVIGNPINEVIKNYKYDIDKSNIFRSLGIRKNKYFLVTLHRAENVDIKERLKNLIKSLEMISDKYKLPVICSLHPRTKSKMEKYNISQKYKNIHYLTPLGFFDFIALEKNSYCVLTDSGTVQEECCLFKVPNVTIRDVTERPETIECGSNIISGSDPSDISNIIELILNQSSSWIPPAEYLDENVSDKVLKILFIYRH